MAQIKRIQAAELKASAAEREVQLLRVSLRQQKEKMEQVHEVLTLREQEHRYVSWNNFSLFVGLFKIFIYPAFSQAS